MAAVAAMQAADAQEGLVFGDDESKWALDGECDDPRFAGEGMAGTLVDADRFHDATDCRSLYEGGAITLSVGGSEEEPIHGTLASGDRKLESGEYVDEYEVEGAAGRAAIIDLRAHAFDTYLFVVMPDGQQIENDDYDGDRDRSLLWLELAQEGTYKVYVTSYEPGETGDYVLDIALQSAVTDFEPIVETGTLKRGDETLSTGEYYDTYDFTGSPGQRLHIELVSSDFDTYVILVPPNGDQQENDDDDSTSRSVIDAQLDSYGSYRVIVTSYEVGETGDYVLTIEPRTASAPARSAGAVIAAEIAIGAKVDGELGAGDEVLGEGEYSDAFEFVGDAGTAVRVRLESQDFDTYVALLTPTDGVIQNDDFDGRTDTSVVGLVLPESGTYRIVVTSYDPGESGRYTLALSEIDPAEFSTNDARRRGKVYGIFTGISDYPGKASDLDFTADDAQRLRDALTAGAGMESQDQVMLIDEAATRDALRSAIESIAGRARPEDSFVFFFSGHGDRVERAGGANASDPDGLDETIELYDGAVTDDDLTAWLADVRAGTSLILLDSCYSGGFAKDLISVPGRMGVFSSEEDVISSVAAKFQAGGYLSLFLADAIEDKRADTDGDQAVSAMELSQYLYDRYRADVKTGRGEFVRSGGPAAGHQRLVVDRGSIGGDAILFR
jgi:hypothetical protein